MKRPIMIAERQIIALLRRKREIEEMKSDQFTATQRWLAESVELLLRMALVAIEEKKAP
jgi:hypothetical protein